MSRIGPQETASPHWLDEPRNVAMLILLQGAVFSGLGLAIWYGSGREPMAFVEWEADDFSVAALTGGALIGSMLAIARAFPGFVGWAAGQQRFLFAHGRRYRPLHILLLSIAAGVGEEALFRGGLQTIAADHLPAWAAILVVSLLFTGVHLGSRGLSAFIFAYSAIFGIVYHSTGSLMGVMLAHTAFDIWAIAVIQRELRQGVVEA